MGVLAYIYEINQKDITFWAVKSLKIGTVGSICSDVLNITCRFHAWSLKCGFY